MPVAAVFLEAMAANNANVPCRGLSGSISTSTMPYRRGGFVVLSMQTPLAEELNWTPDLLPPETEPDLTNMSTLPEIMLSSTALAVK
jgi:hypothetical protein